MASSRRHYKNWFKLEIGLKVFCIFCLVYYDIYLQSVLGMVKIKGPFASDLGSLWNHYGERAKLGKIRETHEHLEDRIRKSNAIVDSWKKLLPYVEEDQKIVQAQSEDHHHGMKLDSFDFDFPEYQINGRTLSCEDTVKIKDFDKLIISLDIFGCEGQKIDECLDDLEEEGKVNLQNLQRIKAISQSDLAVLESLEDDILLSFERHGIIFANYLINFLVCLYILYVLICNGPVGKHIFCLLTFLNCQLFYKIWKDWREFWNEDSNSFDINHTIGNVQL